MTTPSDIYRAAVDAAIAKLPSYSRVLLTSYQFARSRWADDGCPSPEPADLQAARRAVLYDACARAAYRVEQFANQRQREEEA